MLWKIDTNPMPIVEQDNARTGIKEDKLEGSGQGIQYRRGVPLVRGFRECGLGVGRKEVYFKVHPRLLLGEMLCWDGISPKRGKYGRGHLMHAIGVSVVRASSPYPLKVRQK